MRRCSSWIPVALAIAWSAAAEAGVRGDSGWSADGQAYGMCHAWILPDSVEGCRFFDRQTRVWVRVGRREAIALWRPWEPAMVPSGTRPLIAVYPMQEDEEDPGPVSLSGRLVPSDDVVELWSLEGDVRHGERGGDWTTVFDYSPDGLWLAVGAVHVDHETSHNEFFVEVRPVVEWLALAWNRLAIENLARGRIRAGIASLARARALLESGKGDAAAVPPEREGSPLDSTRYKDDDPLHSMTFTRWSTDGRTLCSCDSWREPTGEDKTRCRILTPPYDRWQPVVVSLVHTHCPGYGKPPDRAAPPPAYHFWADGGYDGETAAVSVYMSGGELGTSLGAVMERTWEAAVPDRQSYPAFFHAVGLPGPDGKWLAVGFLREEGLEGETLQYEVEVRRVKEWLEMARKEIALHERSDPPTLGAAKPVIELPAEEQAPGEGEAPRPASKGCTQVMP